MTAVLPRPRESGSPPGAARRRRSRPSEVTGQSSRHAPRAVHGTRSVPATVTGSEAALPERARRILAQPLEYRVCRGFKLLRVLCQDFEQPILPDYAAAVDQRTLLPADQESDLFVRMNYCKFRADILRRQLPQDAPNGEFHEIRGLTPPARLVEATVEEIEDCLATATRLRDCLVRAFLKLAISLIGRFVSRQHPFDELLSEAAVALLRAVEKFDPDRGFRFSTYATPAVRRQLERFVLKQHKDQQVLVRTPHLDTLPAPGGRTRAEDRRRETAVTALAGMIDKLDAREQTILEARFGLEPGSDPESLQEVAGRLGVCRERVRQIEARAIERLRAMSEAARIAT